jgi:FkbM family methyltransferase
MEYKSQYNQDKWIAEEIFPGKTDGYFVELAAGDGIFLSNTYFLEKNLGWSGLCIEPNKKSYQQLITNRNCTCSDRVVLQDEFEVEFVEYKKVTDYEHLLSGISGAQTSNLQIETITKHTAVSLDTLLNECNAPQVIDYISMDIEGSEIYVLQDFLPKNKRIIKAWSIECNIGSPHESDILEWMAAYGYVIDKKDGINGRLGHDYLFLHKNIINE